jgi:hypothetical protein
MSLQDDDDLSKTVATHPRVSLADLEENIKEEHYFVVADAINNATPTSPVRVGGQHPTAVMTICVMVLRNGFVVIGKAAPASPENFNIQIGRKFARDDAMRQLWPLMGYALREKLSQK